MYTDKVIDFLDIIHHPEIRANWVRFYPRMECSLWNTILNKTKIMAVSKKSIIAEDSNFQIKFGQNLL